LDKIRNFWIGWKNRKHSFNSVFDWWEEGKSRIKSLSISYTLKTSKASRKYETSLDKRLRNAIAGGKSGLIRHFSAEIRKVRQKRAHTHFAFRNHRWAEEGEKCTSFINAHKSQVRADTIGRVKTARGITSDNSEILNEFSKFYESLYTETPTSGEAQDSVLKLLNLKLTRAVDRLLSPLCTSRPENGTNSLRKWQVSAS